MDEGAWFETRRPRLVRLAASILGGAEAEDVVQEGWLRLRAATGVEDPDAWLTTVVSRLSLDVLRSARRRFETPLVVERWEDQEQSPEGAAERADAVGAALVVVLDRLSPSERLAFVLHDVFGVPFAEIATILDRSEAAARQLASRGRARVRGAPGGVASRRADAAIVDAWLAAASEGDFARLLDLLDPGAVLQADYGTSLETIRGARGIAAQAVRSARLAAASVRVLVGGRPAVVARFAGRPVAVMRFEVECNRIIALDVLADPARLAAAAW